MLFGKIDYINLLPFHVFLKKSPLQSSFKKSIEYKKGVPSSLNRALAKRKIDAAVVSSITSTNPMYECLDMGIIAQKNVNSVLVKPGKICDDPASETSNALAKILKVNGEVLIGDRALKAYLEDPKAYIDLAKTWNERTGLPFVFARVCITKNSNFYKKLTKNFLKQRVKIPRYILNRYANERQISQNEILNYLKVISYSIGPKEKIALKRFLNLAKSNSCQL